MSKTKNIAELKKREDIVSVEDVRKQKKLESRETEG